MRNKGSNNDNFVLYVSVFVFGAIFLGLLAKVFT